MTALSPQDRYRRLDLLGRGGMGEVFLTDDLLLRRKVAIKVVHRAALANPRAEKLLRREAKAAAALDNPFICKVYEVGEDDGRVFIAMEYIQGETLRQKMQRGRMPFRELLSIAREIADGLEEAGRKGVIHRDLKPSNIIITPQGHVKIMDFGLAKRLPTEDSSGESTGTPEGMVVGTREYMSPEQLRGNPLEPSSDLFALGLILYEALTGVHPFKKAAALDTQFAILNEAPTDVFELNPDTPERLCDLVNRLLKKAPSDRPTIAELRQRLADIPDTVRPDLPPARDRTLGASASASVEAFVARKPRVVLAFGTALLIAFLGLLLWVNLRPDSAMPQARMSTLVTWPSNEEHASLSPDGKSVTFISNRNGVKDIWLMDLAGGEPRRITSQPGNLSAQVFSGDGTEIAYSLESPTQNLLQTIRLDGGPPTRSFELPMNARVRRMLRWVSDDVFIETQFVELGKLSLTTGRYSVIPTLPRTPKSPGDYDVSGDGSRIALAALNEDGSHTLWLQAMGGEPQQVTSTTARDGSPFFSDRAGAQRLFFESTRSGQEDLWFLERPGREPRQITFGSNREFIQSVSSDGRLIVYSEQQEGGAIFSYDTGTKALRQLTAENTRDVTPSVRADGRIAFARTALVAMRPISSSSLIVGTTRDGRLDNARVAVRDGFSPQLSPDGRHLAFQTVLSEAAVPHMNLLDVESGHVRDLGARSKRSLTYMDFAWYFDRRDFLWSPRGVLYFTDTLDGETSRIMKVTPGSDPEVVAVLTKGTTAINFAFSDDGSRLLFVRALPRVLGGTLMEAANDRLSPLYDSGGATFYLLGMLKDLPLVARQADRQAPVVVGVLERNQIRDLMKFPAISPTLRYLPNTRALSFSRTDSVDVQNIFLKSIETGIETAITSNGIQGVAFSPVEESGRGLLVFSQQLRNKDLGIIRLDSR